jgi:DNA-binding response OmpR family regulator
MNKLLTERAADVLLVVSDFGELRRIRDALHECKVKNRLHHVGDAAEASSYVRREGPYMFAPVPGLVLLDASLPQKSIIDLIAELKSDAQFAGIPVIALAGSESERQLIESCMYRVDGSIRKPFDIRDLARVLISVNTLSFLLVQSIPTK